MLISIWIAVALAAFYFVDISAAAMVSLMFVAIAIVKWSWGSSTSGQIYSAQQKLAKYTEELKNSTEQSQARRQKVLLSDRVNKLRSVCQNTTAQLSVATSNKNKISNVYEKAKKTLSNIYALDILPYKYRSLNAAATLYEYLDTGICTIIQGHGGIYDTYEYHLKLGLIISKLDDIIDHLESIESHQRMLYCELKNANDSISSINKELCSFHNSFNDYAAASMEMKRQESAAVQWMAWNQWHNS